MSTLERQRRLHLAKLAERARDIDATRRRLDNPSACWSRLVWLVAVLTGTSAQLHSCLVRRLQQRLARLLREQQALVELLQWQDQSRQI